MQGNCVSEVFGLCFKEQRQKYLPIFPESLCREQFWHGSVFTCRIHIFYSSSNWVRGLVDNTVIHRITLVLLSFPIICIKVSKMCWDAEIPDFRKGIYHNGFVVRQSDSSLIFLFLYYLWCLGDFCICDICWFYICWARHYPLTYINNMSDWCLRYVKPGLVNPFLFGTLPMQNRRMSWVPFCTGLLSKVLLYLSYL